MWHAFLYSNNFAYMNYLILAIQCKVIIFKNLKISKNLSSTFSIVMVLDKHKIEEIQLMISKTLNLQLEMFKRLKHICFYPLTTQIYNHMLNSMLQTNGVCQFGRICQVNILMIEIIPVLNP